MSSLLRLLVEETGLSLSDIDLIARTAPRRYKEYTIPKRSGGMRTIAQPARELKVLQRAIVSRVLINLPVHKAAMAYRAAISVANNAKIPAGHTPILKMDFSNFFPSIRDSDWSEFCRKNAVLESLDDVRLSSRLLFRHSKGEQTLRLAIGAPSSPMLSNVLMYDFDEMVDREALKRKIRYTRYADDMTFSGQRIGMLKDMISIVADTIRTAKRPHLVVNSDKTTFVTTARRRVVTGVTLTNQGVVSLGHERKRRLSSGVHRASLGKLSADDLAELCGQLSFANVVEPEFLVRLRERYGADLIRTIRSAVRKKD